MKRTQIFIFFLMLAGTTMADELHFKNGNVLKNIEIIKIAPDTILIKTSAGTHIISPKKIKNMVYRQYDQKEKSQLIFEDGRKADDVRYEYPNKLLFPLALFSFYLGYDNFKQVSDLGDAIEGYNLILRMPNDEYGIITTVKPFVITARDEAEKEQSKRTLLGICSIASGTVIAVFAFQRIEIRVQNNSVGLAYKL